MASYIPFKYYNFERDVYILPNGLMVQGSDYRRGREATKQHFNKLKYTGYDPRNHCGLAGK